MRSDTLTWKCQNNVDATYSRLFHVPARGFGQPAIECFTSYLVRLANAHSVNPYRLILNEFLPLLEKTYLYANGRPIHNALGKNWWKRISTGLNSLNSTTEQWVQLIEQLTQNTHLRFLTLLSYRDALPNRDLIRITHAWCPECYEEWRSSGQVIYDPLLWVIDEVKVCIKHHRQLQTVCPYSDCGKSLTSISSQAQIGFCPYCNRWLGTDKTSTENALSDEGWQWQEYVVQKVGELLTAAPALKTEPSKENISMATRQYIEDVLDGNAKALADQLGMNHKSIYEIRDGTQLPRLNTLLKLCELFGTSPLQMLTSDKPTFRRDNVPINTEPATRVIKRYRRFDSDSVRATLEPFLVDAQILSMAQVARKIGYDQTFLHTHFPQLCNAISERYARSQSRLKEKRIRGECAEITRVVQELHLQGVYPSYRRIRKKARGGLFREKRVHEVYIRMMKNLGYRK